MLVSCGFIMGEWLFTGHAFLRNYLFLKDLSFYTATLAGVCCVFLLSAKSSRMQYGLPITGLAICTLLYLPGTQTLLPLGQASDATLYAFGFLFLTIIINWRVEKWRITPLVFLMYSVAQFIGVIGVSRYLLQIDSASGSGAFQYLSPSTSLIFLLLAPLLFAQSSFNVMDPKAEQNLAHQNMALALFFLPLGVSGSALLANSVQLMVDSSAGSIPLMLGTSTFLGSFFLYLFGSYAGQKEKEVTTKLKEQALELENLNAEKIEAAEAIASEQSRFSSVLAHEIRTPLSTILGLVEALRIKHSQDLQSIGCDKKFRQIETSAKLLREVINSVLDYTKIKAGKLALNPQPHSVPLLLEELAFLYSSTAQDKVLELSIERNRGFEGQVKLDRARVRGILSNLIDNAIKFTPTGGKITLGYDLEPTPAGELLHIKVKDSGIGLTREQEQRIFQPFKQASDDTSNKYGGTGLGLSYSRELARVMKGDITVSSQTGLGSQFCLTIPVETSEKPVSKSVSSFAQGGSVSGSRGRTGKTRLLMVEDHELNAEIHMMLLNEIGMDVDWVSTGEEALSRFAANPTGYDAILMDIQLGTGLDGLETTVALRTRHAEKLPPVLAMTAGTSDSELHNIEEAGMVGIIAKPLDIQDAAVTIAEAITSRPNLERQPNP